MNLFDNKVTKLTGASAIADFLKRKSLNKTLSQLSSAEIIVAPVMRRRKDVPLELLERVANVRYPSGCVHPCAQFLPAVLKKGEPTTKSVPIKKVIGVSNSKGELRMALDSLPETMWAESGDFGPLSDGQMQSLQASVMNEFHPDGGKEIFHLDYMDWVDGYIAHNSGASRRFALLRRLSKSTAQIQARVTRYTLNMDTVSLMLGVGAL